jgi:hypothetical protein
MFSALDTEELLIVDLGCELPSKFVSKITRCIVCLEQSSRLSLDSFFELLEFFVLSLIDAI